MLLEVQALKVLSNTQSAELYLFFLEGMLAAAEQLTHNSGRALIVDGNYLRDNELASFWVPRERP